MYALCYISKFAKIMTVFTVKDKNFINNVTRLNIHICFELLLKYYMYLILLQDIQEVKLFI